MRSYFILETENQELKKQVRELEYKLKSILEENERLRKNLEHFRSAYHHSKCSNRR